MPDLAATFRKPFSEQVAAWRMRLRELRPTASSADPGYSGHDKAFMVAGAVKADLLADLAEAVDRAVVDGTGFDAFKKDFRTIVQRRGWHGWSGEGSVQGEEWRMRTIYRTNMQTSYMAGRHAQLVDGGYRWWVYRHSGAAHPRLDHLSWDGVALPPDHPFWATHYPPNGWGCGCLVEGARTEAGIRRVGGDPGKVLPDGWQESDPRTGAPVGVGKGWAQAPATSAAQTVSEMSDKLAKLPARPSTALIRDWLESDVFAQWFAKPTGAWPLARLSDELTQRIGARNPIANMPAGVALKQARKHPELSIREYLAAQEVIDGATEIIPHGSRTLVFVKEDDAGFAIVIEAAVSDGTLVILSMRRLSGAPQERRRQLERLRRRNR